MKKVFLFAAIAAVVVGITLNHQPKTDLAYDSGPPPLFLTTIS